MAKRKITAAMQEYRKERRRIQRFIRNAEKRGYDFSGFNLPPIPKTIREASVRKLKSITKEKLYSKARYGGEATYGEIVSGTEGRKAERKVSAQKAAQTKKNKSFRRIENEEDFIPTVVPEEKIDFFSKIVISNYKAELSIYRQEFRSMMGRWVDDLVNRYGENDVAYMLNTGAEDGIVMTPRIAYSDTEIQGYLTTMINYLPNATTFGRDELEEMVQRNEWWDDDYDNEKK